MTTTTKSQLATAVFDMLQSSTDEIPLSEIEKQAEAALQRYSIDRPDKVTGDVTGDGGKYYAVTALTAWVGDFSRILAIEYPAQPVASDETPQLLQEGDWDDDYWVGDTQYIFLPNHAPAATETLRIRYTAPYQFSAAGSVTVPTADYWAIVYLLASYTCQTIAVKYARTTDTIINVDSVDHASRSERFREMAKEYMRQYREHIGLRVTGEDGGASVRPSGTFVDMDTQPTWPTNRQYLFRRGNTR